MATSTFTTAPELTRILLLLLANVFYKPARAVRYNGTRLNTLKEQRSKENRETAV